MMKRFIAIIIILALAVGLVPLSGNAALGLTSYTLPPLQGYSVEGSGAWDSGSLAGIYIVNPNEDLMDGAYDDLVETARFISAAFIDRGIDVNVMFGIASAAPAGYLILNRDENSVLLDSAPYGLRLQAYHIAVRTNGATLTAHSNTGLINGSRAVLQYMLSYGSMPAGTILDYPESLERTLLIDCGRKYYSMDNLKRILREMAWVGMNTLELHFSEDLGLRLESKLYPWLAAGSDLAAFGSSTVTNTYSDPDPTAIYTQDELAELVSYAERCGIDVIPSFDMPGHMNYIVKRFNERVDSTGSVSFSYAGQSYSVSRGAVGTNYIGNYFKKNGSFVKYTASDGVQSRGIDISNPAARAFAFSLLEEYADLFRSLGCTKFNLCADELLGFGSVSVGGTSYTRGGSVGRNLWDCLEHWQSYAVNTLGIQNGTAYDAFVSFINSAADILQGKGYTVRAFNDELYRSGCVVSHVDPDPDIEIVYWSGSAPLDSATVINSDGRTLYNAYSAYAYYVLGASFASDYPNVTVDGILQNGAATNFGGATLPSSGSYFCIWSDNPGYKSQSEVLTEALPLMRARAIKAWKSDHSLTAAEFNTQSAAIGAAPVLTEAKIAAISPTLFDHSALRELLSNVIDPAGYTEDTYYAYTQALNAGRGTDADPYATAAQLSQAIDAINDAIATLALQPTAPVVTAEPVPQTYTYTPPDGISYDIEFRDWDTIELPVVIRDYNNDGMLFEYADSEETQTVTETGSVAPNFTATSANLSAFHEANTTKSAASFNGEDVVRLTSNRSGGGSYVTLWLSDLNYSGAATPANSAYAVVRYASTSAYTPYATEYREWFYRTNVNASTTDGASSECHDFSYSYDGAWHSEVLAFADCGSYAGASSVSYITFFTRLTTGQSVNIAEIAFFSSRAEAEAYIAGSGAIASQTVMNNNLAFGLLFDSMDSTQSNMQGYGSAALSPSMISGTLGAGINKSQTAGKYKKILAGRNSGGGSSLTTDDVNSFGIPESRITGYARTGLVESTLGADGKPAYTQASVEYLAALLNAALSVPRTRSNTGVSYPIYNYGFVQGAANAELYGYDAEGQPRDFAQFLRDRGLRTDESYAETEANFDRSLMGIDSYMDAAYFMLSSLHTSSYSLEIPEYNALVLHKETITGDGAGDRTVYVFDSAYEGTEYNTETGKIRNTTANREDWLTVSGTKYNLNGVYVAKNGFLPINGMGYGNTDTPYYLDDGASDRSTANHGNQYAEKNFNLELEGHAKFIYRSADNLYFKFAGDDDVYLYINGVLALDIGAAHGITEERINLNEMQERLNLVDGQAYTFDFYYLERHGFGANLRIETNIILADPAVSVGKSASQFGTTVPYGGVIEPMAVYEYSFSMENTGNSTLVDLVFEDNTIGTVLAYEGAEYHTLGSYGDSNTPRDISELSAVVYHAATGETSYYDALTDELLRGLLKAGLEPGDSIVIDGLKYKLTDADMQKDYKNNTVTCYARSGGVTLSGAARYLVRYMISLDFDSVGAQAHIIHKSADNARPLMTDGIRFGVQVNFRSLQAKMSVGEYFSFGVMLLPANRLIREDVSKSFIIAPGGQSANSTLVDGVNNMTMSITSKAMGNASNGRITTFPGSEGESVTTTPSVVFFNSTRENSVIHSSSSPLTLDTGNMIQWTAEMEGCDNLSDFCALLSAAGVVLLNNVGTEADCFIYATVLRFDNADGGGVPSFGDSVRLAQAMREIAYRGVFVKLSVDAQNAHDYDLIWTWQRTNSANRIFRHYVYSGLTVGRWGEDYEWPATEGDPLGANDLNGYSLYAPSTGKQFLQP